MEWTVLLHETFDPEFLKLGVNVQDALAMRAKMLKEHGPHLGRPHVDTLKGSKHSNMKELRFDADNGVWRLPLLLILIDKQYCLLREIRQESAKSSFINN